MAKSAPTVPTKPTAKKESNFPLRFQDELTLRVLKTLAKAKRTSVNALVLSMIARGLPREAEAVESELNETLEALRAYKGNFGDDWEAFARAEVAGDDPIRAERVESSPASDPHGITSIFA